MEIRITGDRSSDRGRAAGPRFQAFSEHDLDRIPQLSCLSAADRRAIRVVASVLPFRVNSYVIESLIDWERVPEDPVFQLTFPQPGMLAPEEFARVARAIDRGVPRTELRGIADQVRAGLNPHPGGQRALNVPSFGGRELDGVQHKYPETLLFFPGEGQTCHSYCTFCFRWAQFVGDRSLKFASNDVQALHGYLAKHREVSDLLVTGGDPLVMTAQRLGRYLLPLLSLEHVSTIRIGTKSLSYWPYRFLTDDDAGALLRLFERLVDAGKHVAVMAHYNHPHELRTDVAQEAIRRVRDTGVVIRSQGPLLANINDDADVWARLWRTQVQLGIVPYYMFVERDTGARRYFEVPLGRAYDIYRGAIRQVSGLARTVRGPSMSATPGKVEVQGVAEVGGEKVFVLRFLQGRNPDWVLRPFFARFDPDATWLDDLEPAFGEESFFWQNVAVL